MGEGGVVTASLSTQKQFLGGGVVKNKPNSSKLISLHHIDTNIMEFTWTNFVPLLLAPVIYFNLIFSGFFNDIGQIVSIDRLKKEPSSTPTVFVQLDSSNMVEEHPK